MSNQRLLGLDLLRSLAILSVLALHAAYCLPQIPSPVAQVFFNGWIGVDLFFVLSGFLIGSQAYRMDKNRNFLSLAKEFWIKRWTRTLPLYLFVLFFYVVLKPSIFGLPFQGEPWKFLLFIQNFFPLHDFPQSWSLCIEEQFYLFFPFVFFLTGLRKPSAWLFFFISSFLFRFYFFHTQGWPLLSTEKISPVQYDLNIRFFTPSHLDGISIGLFLSATKSKWIRFSGSMKIMCFCFGTFTVLGLASFGGYSPADFRSVYVFSGLSLGFGFILIAIHDFEINSKVLRALIEKIALWSYGAYLWNLVIMRLFEKYPLQLHWVIGLLLFISPVFCISWFTYKAVEQPGMKLRKRFIGDSV